MQTIYVFVDSSKGFQKIEAYGGKYSRRLISCLYSVDTLKKYLVVKQQRAAIARSLYMEPKLLLADEPTGSLDERNAEAVMRLLTSLTKQLDCTLLLVTHSEKVAQHMEGCIRLQGGQLHVILVVKALLGHYKRHPLQIVLVWLGLTLGVSLLVGVLAINHHAKQSYSAGEKLFLTLCLTVFALYTVPIRSPKDSMFS